MILTLAAGLIYQEDKMTLIKTILLTSITFLFVGCSNTPEEAITDLYDSIKDGDLQKLSRVTTEKTTGAFSLSALRDCTADKPSYNDEMQLVEDCLIEKYKNTNFKSVKITMKSETLADANVSIEQDSKEFNYIFKVYKVNDMWKVSIN